VILKTTLFIHIKFIGTDLKYNLLTLIIFQLFLCLGFASFENFHYYTCTQNYHLLNVCRLGEHFYFTLLWITVENVKLPSKLSYSISFVQFFFSFHFVYFKWAKTKLNKKEKEAQMTVKLHFLTSKFSAYPAMTQILFDTTGN
jgi:hypothetical protein